MGLVWSLFQSDNLNRHLFQAGHTHTQRGSDVSGVANQKLLPVYGQIVSLRIGVVELDGGGQVLAGIINEHYLHVQQSAYQLAEEDGAVFAVGIARGDGFFGEEPAFAAELFIVSLVHEGKLHETEQSVDAFFLRLVLNDRT